MAARRHLEGKQKPRKHHLGRLPHVVPKLELAEVLRQMLGRYMNVGATDRALQLRPEAFDAVDVRIAVHPFIGAVVDRPVAVAVPRELGVGSKVIATDRRAGADVLKDVALKGGFADVRN